MLAPKLLLSGIGVLGLVGTIGYISPDIFGLGKDDNKSRNSGGGATDSTKTPIEYKYIVVSASVINIPSSQTQTPAAPAFNGRNHKCFISDKENEIDETCEIYKLNSGSSDQENYIELPEIKENSFTKLTTVPDATKNYILKIKKDVLDTNKKITLVNKDDISKKYIDLTKVYDLNNENNQFKTNLIIAQISTSSGTLNTSPDNSYKCKFTSADTDFENCKVYSIKSSQSTTDIANIGKWIDPQHLEKLTSSSTQKSQNHFVLIKFETNKTEKELRSYIPQVYKTADNSKLFDTKYISSLTGVINEDFVTSKLFTVKPAIQDYLVVVSSISPNGEKASSVLSDANNKNYKCKTKLEPTIIDDSCELIKIEDPTGNKSNNFETIAAAYTKITVVSDFSANKYFKLKINNPNFMSQTFSDTNLISIESNKISGESDHGKKYGEVKVITKFLNNLNEGKTKWFLTKSNKTVSEKSGATIFKCSFGTSTPETCNIYKTTDDLSSANLKEWNLNNFTKEGTANSDLSQNKFLIVSLNSEKDINVPSNTKISITNGSGSDTSEIGNLDILAPINTIENNNTFASRPIILQ